MMGMAKLIATCFGIGYIQKGAGSVAALFCCLLWGWSGLGEGSLLAQGAHVLLLFGVGVLVSGEVEAVWGHDSNRVVVDEWFGMSVALFAVPFSWTNYIGAFLLFRFFDIAKPLGIRRAERLRGGWGVMADDLLAGLYSVFLLHMAIKSGLL